MRIISSSNIGEIGVGKCVLGGDSICLDVNVIVYCQYISHPGEKMPHTVMDWFRVDSDGIRNIFQLLH